MQDTAAFAVIYCGATAFRATAISDLTVTAAKYGCILMFVREALKDVATTRALELAQVCEVYMGQSFGRPSLP